MNTIVTQMHSTKALVLTDEPNTAGLIIDWTERGGNLSSKNLNGYAFKMNLSEILTIFGRSKKEFQLIGLEQDECPCSGYNIIAQPYKRAGKNKRSVNSFRRIENAAAAVK